MNPHPAQTGLPKRLDSNTAMISTSYPPEPMSYGYHHRAPYLGSSVPVHPAHRQPVPLTRMDFHPHAPFPQQPYQGAHYFPPRRDYTTSAPPPSLHPGEVIHHPGYSTSSKPEYVRDYDPRRYPTRSALMPPYPAEPSHSAPPSERLVPSHSSELPAMSPSLQSKKRRFSEDMTSEGYRYHDSYVEEPRAHIEYAGPSHSLAPPLRSSPYGDHQGHGHMESRPGVSESLVRRFHEDLFSLRTLCEDLMGWYDGWAKSRNSNLSPMEKMDVLKRLTLEFQGRNSAFVSWFHEHQTQIPEIHDRFLQSLGQLSRVDHGQDIKPSHVMADSAHVQHNGVHSSVAHTPPSQHGIHTKSEPSRSDFDSGTQSGDLPLVVPHHYRDSSEGFKRKNHTNSPENCHHPPQQLRPRRDGTGESQEVMTHVLSTSGDAPEGDFKHNPNKRAYKCQPPAPLPSKQCTSCKTSTTPEWRRGPHGPKTLCNACGLQYSKIHRRKMNGSNNDNGTDDGMESEEQQQQQQRDRPSAYQKPSPRSRSESQAHHSADAPSSSASSSSAQIQASAPEMPLPSQPLGSTVKAPASST